MKTNQLKSVSRDVDENKGSYLKQRSNFFDPFRAGSLASR
jgi:hypothetical protein